MRLLGVSDTTAMKMLEKLRRQPLNYRSAKRLTLVAQQVGLFDFGRSGRVSKRRLTGIAPPVHLEL
ncbi:hypothetical protein VP02_00335 [Pseudomonas ogarae]|uniref:Uncharacterized protein n=1 Tax=Pseudomonas kilonensis TaxID=132476 RepID=A0A0F4XVE3_9PSED|nr:hypothetical protein VP02_00335 [Pseudomonas ogarae]